MADNNKECTCGDITTTFYPEENHNESNCWDCYLKAAEYPDHSNRDDLPF
jgi:hypothetical protein